VAKFREKDHETGIKYFICKSEEMMLTVWGRGSKTSKKL
jgi:hypothetical protein